MTHSEELATAKNTLMIMEKSSNGQDEELENRRKGPPLVMVLHYVSRLMRNSSKMDPNDGFISTEAVNASFEAIKGGLQVTILRDMAAHDLVDQDFRLTERGNQRRKNTLDRQSAISHPNAEDGSRE